jgi:hypothetical protein
MGIDKNKMNTGKDSAFAKIRARCGSARVVNVYWKSANSSFAPVYGARLAGVRTHHASVLDSGRSGRMTTGTNVLTDTPANHSSEAFHRHQAESDRR